MTRDEIIEKWDNYRLRYPDAWSRERAVIDEFLVDLAALRSSLAPPDDLVAPAVGSPFPLEHSPTCGDHYDPDARCTCGLSWRIRLVTEQEHRAAWQKRAEEAEARQLAAPAPVAAPALVTPAPDAMPEIEFGDAVVWQTKPLTERAVEPLDFGGLVATAVRQASYSPCQSQRGVVIYQGHEVLSTGFNRKPVGFKCDGSAACKATCRVEAIHAEQAALIAARQSVIGADLIHVKAVDGALVPSGGPSCVACSKLIVEAGIAGVWLFHIDGWQRYDAATFHRLSLASQSAPAVAQDAAPAERDGVLVTKSGHVWPDVPGGTAKDHARTKQPVVAYACLYQQLTKVARDNGYALAMHGSMVADLDLVAVPWTPDAVSDLDLATALAKAAPGSLHADQWKEARPGGVKKHIIHLGGGPYIDLCVTPRLPVAAPATETQRVQMAVRDLDQVVADITAVRSMGGWPGTGPRDEAIVRWRAAARAAIDLLAPSYAPATDPQAKETRGEVAMLDEMIELAESNVERAH